MHTGTISGGTILNIIPELCEFVMEIRGIPSDDPHTHFARLKAHIAEHIEPAMKAVDPACGFTFEIIGDIPGMGLPEEHELATLTKQLAGSNSAGRVSYGTEGGIYEHAGIPTIVCGPGSIIQAHRPDEWIAASQLDLCDRFIRDLAYRLVT
jgi:acetylornithine deacetylase